MVHQQEENVVLHVVVVKFDHALGNQVCWLLPVSSLARLSLIKSLHDRSSMCTLLWMATTSIASQKSGSAYSTWPCQRDRTTPTKATLPGSESETHHP